MRIATFVGEFPVVSETFVLRQITGLMGLGHKVHIYAERRPQGSNVMHSQVSRYNLLAKTTYMDLPPESGYWEMPIWPLYGRTWPPGSMNSTHNLSRSLKAAPIIARSMLRAPQLALEALNPREYGYQAQSLSALYRLARLSSRRGRYDLLHAHFGPVGNSFRFARRLWNAPLVVSFHGYDFSAWPHKKGVGVYRRLFETADAITVNSEHSRGRLEELGCQPAKLHKLPMGVHLPDFPFRERTLEPGEMVRIITVGRLSEKKGIEFSIRAVAHVRAKYPDLRYDVIGDGPLRQGLEELIGKLGMQGVVRLHGAQDSSYVQRMMEQAHIFLLSSVTAANGDQEGQGLVLQEAQASGLPVVATNHNGFKESVAPEESRFLVPERDVDRLAERLCDLITHPERWPAMGHRGRRHVERHYDARVLNRRLAELYSHVITQYRSHNPER